MGSFIPFTEQQREQARRTDLAEFLRQCGEEVKKSGSENMWLDHGQKVTIRGNLWFHQYEQVGGDAIDFACRFYGMDYPEAVLLMIQNLARELFSVANEHGGKLPNRAAFFCDELGTMPPFDILSLFPAGRSRRLTLVPIIQSLAQLEKNYGKEGAEILADNCQDTIFGGFAPNSQTAAALSDNLGSRTVLSGSVTQGKDNNSQSLQMMERPLMSADELKSMPKGNFVVMKTGTHPMKTKLKLFFKWGIRFEAPLQMEDRGSRPVHYAGKADLEKAILSEYPLVYSEEALPAKPNMKAASMPEKTALKT